MRVWLERCMLCGMESQNLVAIQEHVMNDHGYTQDDIRNCTKRAIDNGFIWTMPDGRDWMKAIKRYY